MHGSDDHITISPQLTDFLLQIWIVTRGSAGQIIGGSGWSAGIQPVTTDESDLVPVILEKRGLDRILLIRAAAKIDNIVRFVNRKRLERCRGTIVFKMVACQFHKIGPN